MVQRLHNIILAIAFAIAWATTAIAQDVAPETPSAPEQPTPPAVPAPERANTFWTGNECAPFAIVRQYTVNLNQKALFIGKGEQLLPNLEILNSEIMFFVNQDTGTWTLLTLWPNQVACLVAKGTDFRPYIAPPGGKMVDNQY